MILMRRLLLMQCLILMRRLIFMRRLKLIRRLFSTMFLCIYFYFIFLHGEYPDNQSYYSLRTMNSDEYCHFKPSTDKFILKYKPYSLTANRPNVKRVKPTIERIRNLLEIIRSKEDTYQPLLQNFDVFNMINPDISLKAYTGESNIVEIKTLYNRYIKLMPDNKTVHVDHTIIDYLKQISTYLSDGLENNRTNRFQVGCLRRPVFVLACDQSFFNRLQGAIHTLDTYWPDHKIAFYNLGITSDQEELLREKCKRCTIIKFPFSDIEKYALYVGTLRFYSFKPFVIQDALRRYGTIIYSDSSIRFKSNSFSPILIDNYIRGFAVRELPSRSLPCYTRTGTFDWFNQSYSQYDDITMAETDLLVVTDTFLTRLIMKAWLTCALESECIMALGSKSKCRGSSSGRHRYDQGAMVIILTHFFFPGTISTRSSQRVSHPAPYNMFTSSQVNLGDTKREYQDLNY
ncbi:unnamed protein product [Rotaria socialis]|uniref:Uncharacterized protein n=1 Tax=Rotaria socialis TaxID=392032 RepID=A0A821PQI0_9BILA|nr:unnamed protein product [Rotaria socialis]CAF3492958.1 unnamed protein product [Rotaria socialis]CAF3586554.1 unnamed protein product [Rotaria socialis]CAF3627052.1 unnamed protein product [Rotaria socialis]CAF4302104.1 unnamed protein product [Rotaria socialis]